MRSIGELIVYWFESLHTSVSGTVLDTFGPAGDELRRCGAIVEDDNLAEVTCTECGEDHPVSIEFDDARRRLRYYCGSVGFVDVEPSGVRAYTFNPEWLFDFLHQNLQTERPRQRELVVGVLWELGVARSNGRPWTVFLARDVKAQLSQLLVALGGYGSHPGLVFTTCASPPHDVVLPGGHRWLELRDCLVHSGAQLAIDAHVVRTALPGAVRTSRCGRRPGRPGAGKLLLAEVHRRAGTGETLDSLHAEANALHAWFAEEYPKLGGRSVGTIRNIIRKAHRDIRLRTPRTTK